MPLPPAPVDDLLRFGSFELSPAERVLRVQGQPVVLGSRAFDLLLLLARRPQQLVSKQELLDRVWPGLVVEEHNIATQISTLRKRLGAGAITTIPGQGYRLTVALQAQAAPMADTALPPRPPPHNLPEQRTRFIGREAALAELARLLPSNRLLTLVGIGGCGKTRLALQLARQQRAGFADGTWFVDLAPLKDAGRVASACAAVLGLRDEGDTPLMARLLAQLDGRSTLLVLDNCEQVLAGVVALVDALLAGSSRVTVLATSRQSLGLSGEQIYPVRSLSVPLTEDLPAVLDAESVRVFVDRAQLLWPDFEVDADNAASLAGICRRLDGIALAIELAAARVAMLSVAQIAARLDDRFRLLTGGNRALPRQQTLLAAIEWSYEQLTPAEQRMLQELSVFADGWTLQAASDVALTADEYEALALLTALHDKSLLVVDRGSAGIRGADDRLPAADPRPRYRMLETVRQYALQRLDAAGEGQAARGRLVAHYLALAEAAGPQLRGPAQDAWMQQLRQEHENLIAVLSLCAQGAVDPQSGLRLVAASSYYWIWNSVELGCRLALAVLHNDRAAADTPARAGTLLALANLSLYAGRYEDSLAHGRQALLSARRVGEPVVIARSLDVVGSALHTLGRVDEALPFKQEALVLARPLGDAPLMLTVLNNLAELQRSLGDLDTAEAHYREALALSRPGSGRLGIVSLLCNLIRVQVARGRPDPAQGLAIECLPLVRDQKISVDLLDAAAGLASCRGRHDLAARWWGVSDQKLREWGYRFQPVDVQHAAPLMAGSRQALGDAAFEAAETAGRALDHDAALDELQRWLQGGEGGGVG